MSFFGGSGWVRTTVGTANRFTVCPLWPLGYTPIYFVFASILGGAGGRTRTPDLLITNQLHYQLCYTSISATNAIIHYDFSFVNRNLILFLIFFIKRNLNNHIFRILQYFDKTSFQSTKFKIKYDKNIYIFLFYSLFKINII